VQRLITSVLVVRRGLMVLKWVIASSSLFMIPDRKLKKAG
jgi:hypothetical protein